MSFPAGKLTLISNGRTKYNECLELRKTYQLEPCRQAFHIGGFVFDSPSSR
jgi:hypothetical protein